MEKPNKLKCIYCNKEIYSELIAVYGKCGIAHTACFVNMNVNPQNLDPDDYAKYVNFKSTSIIQSNDKT